jgi:hypothetical protein
MIRSRSPISAMLKKMKYAHVSPITDAAMDTMNWIGKTMLVQRLTLGLRTSERKIITLAIAM